MKNYRIESLFWLITENNKKIKVYPFFYCDGQNKLIDIFKNKEHKANFGKINAVEVFYDRRSCALPDSIYNNYSKKHNVLSFLTPYEMTHFDDFRLDMPKTVNIIELLDEKFLYQSILNDMYDEIINHHNQLIQCGAVRVKQKYYNMIYEKSC